ncbi:MAG: cytochrome c-type biogenesis protein CcmH [Cellvibrionaceae bacterium]|jgi:cytochrome c-type biogenesis protein CcmH
MNYFYLIMLALLVLGCFFVCWPWFQGIHHSRKNTELIDRQSTNVDLYRDHLADLEASRAQGNLDQQQFEQLKRELEYNLLEDSSVSDSVRPEVHVKQFFSSSHWPLFMVVFLLAVSSFALYQMLGNADGWQIKQKLDLQSSLEKEIFERGGDVELEQQLDQLNRQVVTLLGDYVARHPDNLDNRLLLARNAINTGQYDDAIEMYQQILERQPEATEIMAELAQTIFVKAGNRAVPIVGVLGQRALDLDPKNLMALGLMGIYAFQNQQYEQAIQYWQRAIDQYPQNSPNARALQNGLTQARSRLLDANDGDGTVNQEAVASADRSIDTDGQSQVATKPVAIKIAVSVSQDLSVDPNHTVFIYARHWQGSRVPLAITRVKVSDLPLTVELNDSMAMVSSMNLSSVKQLELVARISETGNAMPQESDIQVTLGPIESETREKVYSLAISRSSG